MEKKYNYKLRAVRKAAHSKLKTESDWQSLNLFNHYFEPVEKDNISRIDCLIHPKKDFIRLFEQPNLPCVVLNAMHDWKARDWTPESLRTKYRNEKFKVGEDDNEKVVYMGLKYYLRYATDPEQGLKDDSPLYIFDATFGKRKLHHSARRGKVDVEEDKKHRYDVEKSQATTHLVDDYSVPEYFRDDLFQLAGGRRPPFRWIVIGPPRSGTGIHVDPLGTSAWNALISGVKRWVLFPPETSKSIVKPKLKNSEASTWFAQVYPRLKEKDANGESLGDRLGMVEVVQVAGETMFVPGGWLHIVMNVEFSIAITQNFASVTNLEYVWLKTRFSRPKLADKLLRMIKDKSLSPALYKFSKGKRMRRAVKDVLY